MSGLLESFRYFVVITAQMAALFLVLSFLIGLLRVWIPEERLRSMFEKRSSATAYLGGAAFGAITPFCSFSTIPVLVGLLRSGAPFGPTMTFLFASPLLDPVVLGVLVFVIGIEGAILYAVVTFAAAIVIGVALAKLGFESDIKEKVFAEESAGDGDSAELPIWRRAWREAWSFFVPVLPYLLIGTAIGAVIYGFVPTSWISAVAGPDRPLAIPAAAALGVPIYVNAETFFPITNAFMERGMGAGAMVALVITSMGVSLPEISMLAAIFRSRLVITLVASVFTTAVGGGTLFALTLS